MHFCGNASKGGKNHYPGTPRSGGNESGCARVSVCVLRDRVASRSASPLLFTEGERVESDNRDLT